MMRDVSASVRQNAVLGDHQPCVIPTKKLSISKSSIFRGWCTNSQNLTEQQNVHHLRIAMAIFNMVFVGVVHGLWASKYRANGLLVTLG